MPAGTRLKGDTLKLEVYHGLHMNLKKANMPDGEYKLGIGIINTIPNDSKDITLAINNPVKIVNEWIYFCDI